MLVSRSFRLSRARILSYLDELAQTGSAAKSLYLPPGPQLTESGDTLDRALTIAAVPADLHQLVGRSQTGAVLFWGMARKCLLLPPFPVPDEHTAHGYDVGPLRSLLSHDFTVALVLVRLGAYSIGICQGSKLIDSKTGTGLVHSRHKKGGSSQGRFARHREKQIEQFLDRVCAHVREHIEPHARSVDYLVYGGARTTIISLRKQCPVLRQFEDRILGMMLDIREPRKAVLEQAVVSLWSTTVWEWCEEDL